MGTLRPKGFEGQDLRGRTMPTEMRLQEFTRVDMRETVWSGTTCHFVSIAGSDLRGATWKGCTFNLFSHALDMGAWAAYHSTAGARFASYVEAESFLSTIRSDEPDLSPHLDFQEFEGDARQAKIEALCTALRLRIEA